MAADQFVFEFHEYANLFPLLEGDDYERFKADIAANGMHEYIGIYEKKILDGRNRYRACKELGLPLKIKLYEGDDPVAFVLSQNLHRRHLDESQRAMVAARAKPMFEEEARKRQQSGRVAGGKAGGRGRATTEKVANLPPSYSGGKSRDQAAATVNVSGRSVQDASKVLKDGDKDLIDAVDQGEASVSDAAKVADQPKAKQREAVKKKREGKAKTLQQAVKTEADALGQPIPADLQDAFADRLLPDALADLERLIKAVRAAGRWNPFLLLAESVANLEDARNAVKAALVYCVHQRCKGKGCAECRKTGWLPKWRYQELEVLS